MEFRVGSKVEIQGTYVLGGSGVVVHIFERKLEPDPSLVEKYYMIDKSHRNYQSVSLPKKVDRMVVERNGGGYVIFPLVAKISDWVVPA